MSSMREPNFKQRVRNNGVELKNVPNVELDDGLFQFSDYVSKDPANWGYVPTDLDEVSPQAIADEMYAIYEDLAEGLPEVTIEQYEGDMYWANVEVDVPDNSTRQERVAEQVAEAIFSRQQL